MPCEEGSTLTLLLGKCQNRKSECVLTFFLESKSQVKSYIIYTFIPVTPELGLQDFPLWKSPVNVKCLAKITLLPHFLPLPSVCGCLWGAVWQELEEPFQKENIIFLRDIEVETWKKYRIAWSNSVVKTFTKPFCWTWRLFVFTHYFQTADVKK